jgi:hypothetical protein
MPVGRRRKFDWHESPQNTRNTPTKNENQHGFNFFGRFFRVFGVFRGLIFA